MNSRCRKKKAKPVIPETKVKYMIFTGGRQTSGNWYPVPKEDETNKEYLKGLIK